MTQSERFDYIKELWLKFIARRGSVRPTMSSNEFNLIATWMDQGVPLRVVLQAMADSKGDPRTLLYFERPVEQEWTRVRRAMSAA